MADELEDGAQRPKGEVVGLVVGALIAGGLVAFVLQNTREVRIEWLAWDLNAPLWLVMVVTAAGALVLARIVAFVVRRRRRS